MFFDVLEWLLMVLESAPALNVLIGAIKVMTDCINVRKKKRPWIFCLVWALKRVDAKASVMVRAHVPQLLSYSICPGSGSVAFKNACVKYDLPSLIYSHSATLCPISTMTTRSPMWS